jgi:aldehyde dehydrogenase (NAD+)
VNAANIIPVNNLIKGAWVAGTSGETVTNINPATGEPISAVSLASTADVATAVAAAKEAYQTWRKVPAPKRGEYMYRLADILKERKVALGRVLTMEMGKVTLEAEGEVQEAIDMAYYMAGEGRRLAGQVVPSELPNKWAMTVREPLGVIGAISAFNFPIAVPSWKILPALMLGNTVVWKPSTNTSATGAAFAQAFVDAGFPAGTLSLVTGGGETVGHALVEHPDVAMITFTGSTATGRQIYTQAAAHLKKVSLELGGKNAVIVMDDADLDVAAEGVAWAAFGTSGQRCTATSRVIVHEAVLDAFARKLVERASQVKIGNGLDAGVEVGPVINAGSLENITVFVEDARREGVNIYYGGNVIDRPGYYYEPTLIGPVARDSKYAREEIFGPVLSVITVKDLDEAIAVNNEVAYGLSASIFTQNINAAFRAVSDLDTGIVYVNHGTTGAEIQLPFGGTKNTGNGTREAGQAALDAFSEWKAIYIDYSGKIQRAQIDTDFLE